jgi:DNA polymerase III subunit epsilon
VVRGKERAAVKGIIFFDVESTGVNPAHDHIISLYAVTQGGEKLSLLINPGIPIPAEATAVHGITDEMVRDKPSFRDVSLAIDDFFSGHDIAGFNITNFDTLILWEEFYRAGIVWDLSGVRQIDVGTIFKRKEERTLSAAVRFYLGREHDGAHNAEADVMATLAVFDSQLWRYPDLMEMSCEQLESYSLYDEKRFDLAGKMTIDADGDPVYTFGNSKGVKVKKDLGFARWMLSKDFPTETKIKLKAYLENLSGPTLFRS